MTLRQFVEFGTVGTREERWQFEQNLLEGWADASEHGITTNPNVEADHEVWAIGFRFMKEWRAAL